MLLLKYLIAWPKQVAEYIPWIGALVTRVVIGYTFMISGAGKLNNIDATIGFFTGLGIPAANMLAPTVAGWEFIGGLLLILGLITRITAGGLAVIMLVAIATVKLAEIADLFDLFSNPEATYFVVFTWLAVSGAGKVSLDHLVEARLKGDVS